MYNSYGEFETAVSAQWTRYRTTHQPNWYNYDLTLDDNKTFEWDDGYKLYHNTKNSTLAEQLLGETSIRSNIALMNNFGTVSGSRSTIEHGTVFTGTGRRQRQINASDVTEYARRSRGTMTGPRNNRRRVLSQTAINEMLRQGSVLNDAYWWPYKNDCWVIGGVHGLKRFHLARSFPVPDDLLWDKTARRPRVLGRELIGLFAFGYTWVAKFKKDTGEFDQSFVDLFGLIFAPTDKARAQSATFKDYLDAVEACRTLQGLKDMVFATAKNYDEYDFATVNGTTTTTTTTITPSTTTLSYAQVVRGTT